VAADGAGSLAVLQIVEQVRQIADAASSPRDLDVFDWVDLFRLARG
jgi:hypothetical protein